MPRIPTTQLPPYPIGGSASEQDGPPNGERRLLNRDALISKGVTYSRPHLWKLVEAGKFPRPIKIGRINFWVEAEVNQHIDRLIAERDRKGRAA
jgi:predicted DNA-binding transcriptional regulator AlpA